MSMDKAIAHGKGHRKPWRGWNIVNVDGLTISFSEDRNNPLSAKINGGEFSIDYAIRKKCGMPQNFHPLGAK